LKGCGSVDDLAKQIGAKVANNDQVKVRDLPAVLQPIMLGLRVGEATPPFGSDQDGVRAWVVCGRDEPQEASLPAFDAIQQQLSDERVNLRARRYLRDLRRDAVIDYR
jgi:peptidyl-prolyl cis-trans isomerase SurA